MGKKKALKEKHLDELERKKLKSKSESSEAGSTKTYIYNILMHFFLTDSFRLNIFISSFKKSATEKSSKESLADNTNSEQQSLIEDEEDDDMELYFTDPHQLLDIFLELEEQNLSLIQNSQDTEEALEEMKQTINKTKIKMERETETLKKQIAALQDEIKKEVEKEADLRLKASYFSYGEFEPEEQDKMLSDLNKKVEEVYTNCIGPNEANISTLQMLTNIENRLEELFQKIEQMPPEKVEEAEKVCILDNKKKNFFLNKNFKFCVLKVKREGEKNEAARRATHRTKEESGGESEKSIGESSC